MCAARGYRAGTAACDIRGDGDRGRLDVTVVFSESPAAAAGVFTRNTVKAAPVVISQLAVRRGLPISAVVVNAGNANACTGPQGFRDALVMSGTAADVLGIDPAAVLVCSTGVIGRAMPMDAVRAGVRDAARSLDADGLSPARAMMTTDTRPKTATAVFHAGGVAYTVGGMAKGAGMMHPNMATLLAIVTTDARIEPAMLQRLLADVADDTFNRLTVDGDTSTNDSVILLANGAAGGHRLGEGTESLGAFAGCLHSVCESLAEQVVADAEGATRHFRVEVSGAAQASEARDAAMAVASSPLVKTAVHGGDPNWGRVIAALGRSGASFTLDSCRVSIGGLVVFERGAPATIDLDLVRAALLSPGVAIEVDLGAGEGRGHAWGCDLTADYVRINADYTT